MNTNPIQKNRSELVAVLQEEWVKIPESVLENLVNSMPRRVKAVVQNKGNPTMY